MQKSIFTIFAMGALFSFFSCSYSGSSGGGTPVQPPAEKEKYLEISRLAFTGGGAIYAPGNQNLNQLKSGAKIAIRTNELRKDAPVSVKDERFGETYSIDSFTDVEATSVYGILTISGVSDSFVTFNYQKFDRRKALVSAGIHTIELGKTLDLDKDGSVELSYDILPRSRQGLEGARQLKFICDEKTGSSTMFSVINNKTIEQRAAIGYDLIGANEDGNFIYMTSIQPSDNRSAREGLSIPYDLVKHGDYIIYEPLELEGRVALVENPGSDSIDSLYSENSPDYYAVVAEKGKDDVYVKSTAGFKDTENEEIPELSGFLEFFYDKDQFSSEDGPKELLKALPKDYIWKNEVDINTCSSEEAVNILNGILLNPFSMVPELYTDITLSDSERREILKGYCGILVDYLNFILSKVGWDAPEVDQLYEDLSDPDGVDFWETTVEELFGEEGDEEWVEYLDDEIIESTTKSFLDVISFNRKIIEKNYEESPRAIIPIPSISTVFPNCSVLIGEASGDEFPEVTPTGSSTDLRYANYTDASRGMAKNWSTFKKEKSELKNYFNNNFWTREIVGFGEGTPKQPDFEKAFKVIEDDKNADLGIRPTIPATGESTFSKVSNAIKSANASIKVGVGGGIKSSWGHFQGRVQAGVFVNVDATLAEAEFQCRLFEQELAGMSVTVFIGPIPFSIVFDSKFVLSLYGRVATPFDYAVGFVGVFGGGYEFNIYYGVRWKWIFIPVPYVEKEGHTYKINRSSYYAGPTTPQGQERNLEFQVDLVPQVNANLKIGVGPKLCHIGVTVKNKFAVDVGFLIAIPQLTAEKRDADFWTAIQLAGADRGLYYRIGLGFKSDLNAILGITIPIINKTIKEWNLGSWNLLDVQYVLKDGTLKETGGKKVVNFYTK